MTYDYDPNDLPREAGGYPARSIEDDVEQSLENIDDGGGTVAAHAALLSQVHHVPLAEALHRLTGDCLCCGHGREFHTAVYTDQVDGVWVAPTRPCTAELFTAGEEVLVDCPCSDYVYWPEGAVRV